MEEYSVFVETLSEPEPATDDNLPDATQGCHEVADERPLFRGE